jgi:hypothetical protein
MWIKTIWNKFSEEKESETKFAIKFDVNMHFLLTGNRNLVRYSSKFVIFVSAIDVDFYVENTCIKNLPGKIYFTSR